ncbi:AcrR family transcriptional regulator [Confluentimicrobium naphthalenivorans]|uniref:AcrR family transcriptional regulator n=1 Tax=Actibacterium naphthalenivorans TaxID=1614693 RepID=A0A840CKB7_9RHOB|nr:AcrR family transcriptional regulator [Actibacterium naphthalenivorans]
MPTKTDRPIYMQYLCRKRRNAAPFVIPPFGVMWHQIVERGESTMKQAKQRKKLGRPEGQTNLSDKILDVAEVSFADLGYAGTSLRQVADQLGVNAAMIAYYFDNKENLFKAVFLRKGNEVAAQRMKSLEALTAKGAYDVEALVRAFLEPSAKYRKTKQGRAFLRLHARLHMEPEALSFQLRREAYNESTKAYAEAFHRVLPHLPIASVYHKLSLMIGAYLYAFSDTNRLDELIDMEKKATVQADLFEDIVRFAVAGMKA